MSLLLTQLMLLGPTLNVSSLRITADSPRSVIVHLPFFPYVTTFMQQWLCGFFRPYHRYQGEKTDPINAITEIAFSLSVDIPSRYHQA